MRSENWRHWCNVTNRTRRELLAAAGYSTVASIFAPRLALARDPLFTGTWSAFLDTDDPPTRLKLVIDAKGAGHLTVINVGDIPISRLEISGPTLRLMAVAPAMGVGWQFQGGTRQVLVDGNRSVRASVPVTRPDQWHLGSVTKSMTATLAARIVESGRLHCPFHRAAS